MGQLDIFSLEGRVALVAGGGGAIGVGAGRGAGGRRARASSSRAGPPTRSRPPWRASARPGPRAWRWPGTPPSEADADRVVAAARDGVRAGRHPRERRRRRGGPGAAPGRGVPARRVGLDHGAQRPEHDRAGPGRRPGADRAGHGRRRPQHHLGARAASASTPGTPPTSRPRARSLADPAVGDRVGEARHPGQRDHAHVRRHAPGRDAARRPGVQGRHRQPDPDAARGRDCATSSAPRSSCARTRRRSSPGRSSGSTAA